MSKFNAGDRFFIPKMPYSDGSDIMTLTYVVIDDLGLQWYSTGSNVPTTRDRLGQFLKQYNGIRVNDDKHFIELILRMK